MVNVVIILIPFGTFFLPSFTCKLNIK
jgi:hypothetical protein